MAQDSKKERNINKVRKEKVEQFQLEINEEKVQSQEMESPIESVFGSKKSSSRKKLFNLVWIFMIVAISLMVGQFFVFGACDMLAMNRNDQVVMVEIPKHASRSTIANTLHDKGVIKNASFFKFYTFLTGSGSKFVPGTFEIKTDLDYEAIISFLKSNNNRVETDLINVTIPEGKSILEISDILEHNEICEKAEFLNACKSDDFNNDYSFLASLKNHDKLAYKLEGYLFPDTYKFYKNIKPSFVIKKMLSNYTKKVMTANTVESGGSTESIESKVKSKGMLLEDVINLASLIQAEAANTDDMYNVSSVLHNRLDTLSKSGVSQFGESGLSLLGMDSTVWYPYRSRDKVPEDMIESYSRPYDTYKNQGLPIGPICNPGLVAIDAAINPKATQFYYFCHSKDGKAFYAKKMSEHQNNLKLAGLS